MKGFNLTSKLDNGIKNVKDHEGMRIKYSLGRTLLKALAGDKE